MDNPVMSVVIGHLEKGVHLLASVRECLIVDQEISPDLADEVISVLNPFFDNFEEYSMVPYPDNLFAQAAAEGIAKLMDIASRKNIPKPALFNMIKNYIR